MRGRKLLLLPSLKVLLQVEIEIPRRGDENCLEFSLTALALVEIEIPRRGDENIVLSAI